MKKQYIFGILGIFFSAFSVARAQAGDIFAAEVTIYGFVAKLELLLWALAIAVFFWGLVKFISNAGDTADHEKGKELIVWGIISFVVLVSVWAIVQLIAGDTFGYSSNPVQYIDKDGNAL
jgi:hypothetical protein